MVLISILFLALTFFNLPSFNQNSFPQILGVSGNSLDHDTQSIKEKCHSSPRGEFCYIDEFEKITKINSFEYALEVLKSLQSIDSKVRGCHFIAHVIANTEIDKNPSKWEDILTKFSADDCTGGFLMGALEGYQKHFSHASFDDSTIVKMCDKINTTTKGNTHQNCYHVFGHLTLVEKSGDVDNSIILCQKLPSSYQDDCLNGVFMENEVRRNLVSHGVGKSIPWNETTTKVQQNLCESYLGEITKACWKELSHMFVYITQSAPPKVYEYCIQAENLENIDECYLHSVGIMAISQRFDTKNLKDLCQPYFNSPDLERCINVFLNTVFASYPNPQNISKDFCSTIPMEKSAVCFEKISSFTN